MESLPASLEESAMLDGAGYIKVFTSIITVSYTHLDVYKRQAMS